MKAGQGDNKKKIVLYTPTFRDSEIEFFDHMKIKLFEQFLQKNNILFCIKLHPKSKFKKNFDALQSDNIYVIETESDPYIFLKYTDALITDYSSIYFDYLLLNKPILFFCYDFDQYIQNSREMYFDYNEFTPGIKVQTMEELENALLDIDAFSENYDLKLKREKIRDIVFDNIHDKGSEILYEYIRNKILANPRE
jgi:CDP-glycerol glycerophosphotransferase (TagB/SpsB family)